MNSKIERAQIIHSDQREAELQKLCTLVRNTDAEWVNNMNGPDYYECPFCKSSKLKVKTAKYNLADYEHKIDCAYLIAKDLSTNLIP